VTLVLYGDYECPYTRQAYRVVQRLLADENGTLRFVFRHFPLTSIHPHAEHSAEAAEAAVAVKGEEAFWAMHDALFSHQHALEDADLVRYALELGLNGERVTDALQTRAYSRRIQEDVRSGLASGVQGTPTLYFNGHQHAGSYDEPTMRATIARLAAGSSQTL
jgi:protein-disulfide isomerase